MKEKKLQRELEECTFIPKINKPEKKKQVISPEDEDEDPDDTLNRDIDNDLGKDPRHWVERLAQIKPDFSKIQDQVLP